MQVFSHHRFPPLLKSQVRAISLQAFFEISFWSCGLPLDFFLTLSSSIMFQKKKAIPNPGNPGNPNSDSSDSSPGGSPPPSKTFVKTISISVASAVALVTLTLAIVIIRRRRQQAEHWREQDERLQQELQQEKPGLKRVSTFKEAYDAYHNRNQRRAGLLLLHGGMNSSSTSADTTKSTSKDPKQPLEEFWNP